MESAYFAYITFFFITLVIGAMYCIGIWISRDGETEVDPQGKERVVWSMILYPLYRYLSNERKIEVVYNKDYYEELSIKLNQWFPEINVDLMKDTEEEVLRKIKPIQGELEEKYFIKVVNKYNHAYFQKQYYQVNKWSKPIIACYKCYASFHGSIVFLLSSMMATRLEFIEYDLYILLPMWIIYVFSLVTLNVLLEKKIN
jgi:hypothetical protein